MEKQEEFELQDDEIALVALNILYTEKNMKSTETNKNKIEFLMIKYSALYCPVWTNETEENKYIGMILFPTTMKKDDFYKETKELLDLEQKDGFVVSKKRYVPEKVLKEAEEFWKEYMD